MKRVLIVDDEQSFLLSLRDGLKASRKNFQVLTAENGREAVAVLKTVPIDLLVTDLKMPVMDGFELLAWVSRQQPQLPVIVMTAFGTAEIETRLSKMSALQYLEKPLDLNMLRDAIYTGLQEEEKSYIRGITLATFLQLMAAEQKNCTLKVSSGGQSGHLFLRRGELLDAQYGELKGEAAALEIIAWENAEIEMDGVCRRQRQSIKRPMEHLLMEAFRLKDERAVQEQETAPVDAGEGQPAAPAPEPVGGLNEPDSVSLHELLAGSGLQQGQLLRQALQELAAVQEYAIYAPDSQLEEKSSGCSIAEFDPRIYSHLLEQIDAQVSLGIFSSLSFRTASRSRYLLFSCEERRVLTRLKPGSEPEQVLKEINRYVNRSQ